MKVKNFFLENHYLTDKVKKMKKKTAVPKRRNSGPEFAEIPGRNFFKICKIFHHEIFNQKLKSASGREFNSLNDALCQFAKFGVLIS
jgi:hypothetical protein